MNMGFYNFHAFKEAKTAEKKSQATEKSTSRTSTPEEYFVGSEKTSDYEKLKMSKTDSGVDLNSIPLSVLLTAVEETSDKGTIFSIQLVRPGGTFLLFRTEKELNRLQQSLLSEKPEGKRLLPFLPPAANTPILARKRITNYYLKRLVELLQTGYDSIYIKPFFSKKDEDRLLDEEEVLHLGILAKSLERSYQSKEFTTTIVHGAKKIPFKATKMSLVNFTRVVGEKLDYSVESLYYQNESGNIVKIRDDMELYMNLNGFENPQLIVI